MTTHDPQGEPDLLAHVEAVVAAKGVPAFDRCPHFKGKRQCTRAAGHEGVHIDGLGSAWDDAGELVNECDEQAETPKGGYFPPGPADADAWRARAESGDPGPALRRGADGFPGGLDTRRRLKALGNAVQVQCAEMIGRAIREAA